MGSQISYLTNVLVAAEKVSVWCVCTIVLCCIIFMLGVMLMLGIGVGYNYCFVDLASRYRYVPQQYFYPGSPRWPYRTGEIDEGIQPKGVLVTVTPRIMKAPKTSTQTRQRYKFSRKTVQPITWTTTPKDWTAEDRNKNGRWFGKGQRMDAEPISMLIPETTVKTDTEVSDTTHITQSTKDYNQIKRENPTTNDIDKQTTTLPKIKFELRSSSINLIKSVNGSLLANLLSQLDVDMQNEELHIVPYKKYTMYIYIT